jgi:hypothetical protein
MCHKGLTPWWLFGFPIPLAIIRLTVSKYLVQQVLWVCFFYNPDGFTY